MRSLPHIIDFVINGAVLAQKLILFHVVVGDAQGEDTALVLPSRLINFDKVRQDLDIAVGEIALRVPFQMPVDVHHPVLHLDVPHAVLHARRVNFDTVVVVAELGACCEVLKVLAGFVDVVVVEDDLFGDRGPVGLGVVPLAPDASRVGEHGGRCQQQDPTGE